MDANWRTIKQVIGFAAAVRHLGRDRANKSTIFHCTFGSPLLVVITQAYNLAASKFSAFCEQEKCISRYVFLQTSGRAVLSLIFAERN